MGEVGTTPAPDEAGFLAAAVQRWRAELKSLDQRREAVAQKLEAAEKLLALVAEESPMPTRQAPVVNALPSQLSIPEITISPRLVKEGASWIDAVRVWVHSAPVGLDYRELRAAMQEAPGFAERFRQSEKGYYGAIARLAANREIIKHNNRLYSPEAFETFRREVDAGRMVDEPVPLEGYSPMGEAILQIVGRNEATGILGKDIIQELRTDPEFDAALTPHQTGAYNIIARLVKRNQIQRRDDGLCFPGIRFPKPSRPLGLNGSTSNGVRP